MGMFSSSAPLHLLPYKHATEIFYMSSSMLVHRAYESVYYRSTMHPISDQVYALIKECQSKLSKEIGAAPHCQLDKARWK